MADIFDMVGDAVTTDPGNITDYPAGAGEAFEAGLDRALDTNPFTLGVRALRTFNDDMASIAGVTARVDQKTAEEEVRSRGLDLKIPMGGMTRQELDMLQYLKQREISQNTVGARSGFGASVAGFAGGLVGSLTDPINAASNFIPFVSEYRYARWLAQAGEGTLARAAVRVGAGAIEGAAGAAVVEPLVYAGATSQQLDYTSTDSFLNVALGGVMGGGLHALGGAVYDARVSKALRGLDTGLQGNAALRDAVALMPEHKQRELLQEAVAAMERGEPVDVTPQVARHVEEARAQAGKEVAALKSELETVGDDAARAAEIETRLEAVKASAPPPEAQATFTTAKGSVYQVHADGTTTRNKAFRPEHGADEQGPQATSDVTVYLTLDQARALATPENNWRMFRHDDGTVSLISKNKDGAWGISPTSKNIPVSTQPQKGLLPLELWHADPSVAGKKGTAYKRVHFGNEIVDVRAEAPKAPPRDLGGLIEQSRADRSQGAFDRQVVDDAAATIAAEKTKPKDKVEAVKQEEAEFLDVVEEYRGQGRVTDADDRALKFAADQAAWAERRAKAFEAAAGCIEAA
jgi:hypothetical protein